METASTLGVRRRDDVATLIRCYRRGCGLSQEALAERAGVSVGAISYLERGLTQSPHRERYVHSPRHSRLANKKSHARAGGRRATPALKDEQPSERTTWLSSARAAFLSH